MKLQRNDRCSCNSGLKYKKCCFKKQVASIIDQISQRLASYAYAPSENDIIFEKCDKILEKIESGCFDETMGDELEQLEDTYAEHPMILYTWGALLHKDYPLDAIECLEEAIERCPEFVEAHYNLASLYMDQVQVTAAIKSLQNVVRYETDNNSLLRKKRCC